MKRIINIRNYISLSSRQTIIFINFQIFTGTSTIFCFINILLAPDIIISSTHYLIGYRYFYVKTFFFDNRFGIMFVKYTGLTQNTYVCVVWLLCKIIDLCCSIVWMVTVVPSTPFNFDVTLSKWLIYYIGVLNIHTYITGLFGN